MPNGIKAPMTPTFTDAMNNFRAQIFYDLFCHLPGSIVSYDRATGLASVQPGLKRVYPNYTTPSGQTTAPYPQINGVPVFMVQGGGVSIGVDPVPGDPCLLCIVDRNMDAWKQNGGQPAPLSDRAHSLADCFAIVGFNPLSKPLASARDEGEAGIAEPLAGTGAKVVVMDGKISVANNAKNLATILASLMTTLSSLQAALASMTTASILAGTTQATIAGLAASIATITADLAALLY